MALSELAGSQGDASGLQPLHVLGHAAFAGTWLALAVEGAELLAFGVEGKGQTRLEAPAPEWAPNYAFTGPGRPWPCKVEEEAMPNRIAAA